MATFDDVREVALALPDSSERVSRDNRQWIVGGRLFVWERPLTKVELKALGETAPNEPILGVRVADTLEKQALIEGEPELFFTTPHFDGYPIVLVLIERVDRERLTEIVTEAWLTRAPDEVARKFSAGRAP